MKKKDGKQENILTKFVVDANGHRSIFAHWQRARKVNLDCLMGVAAVFTWKNKAPSDYFTTIKATESGWWYGARLPNNRAIATLMSDPDILQKYPATAAFIGVDSHRWRGEAAPRTIVPVA